MNRFTLAIGLALAQTIAAPLAAAEVSATVGTAAPAATQSLAQAVNRAWNRAAAAAALPHRRTEAEALASAAASWTPGPPIVAMSTLGDRLQARTGRQEWELEIATPLWQRGQREAQRSEAQANLSLLEARTLAQRFELAGQVREAWWDVMAARDAMALLSMRLASAHELQLDVERRWRAGDLARTDANTARAETQAVQSDRVDAEREERRAELAWTALVGSAAPAQLPAEAVAPSPPRLDAHPVLLAGEAQIAAAQAQLRLADRSRSEAPELALRWIRERGSGAEPYANALGLQLRVPLSSAPRVGAGLAGKRAELAELETLQLLRRAQIAREVERAQRDLEATENALSLAGSRSALTADTLQLVQKSFALGETDLATLVRRRAEFFGVEAEKARQVRARSAAISKLNQMMGALP